MPDSGAVTNKNEAQEFIDQYLAPAADMIAGTDFEASSLHKVNRDQEINFDDTPGSWIAIGFSALKIPIANNQHETLFNIWVHQATTADHIPFTESAQEASRHYRARLAELVGGLADIDDDNDVDDYGDDEDDDYEQEVIEQRDYYVNGRTLGTTYDLDWVFIEDGEIMDVVQRGSSPSRKKLSEVKEERQSLKKLDKSFAKEFDTYDTATILNVLGRLGLSRVT
jgi:hypothetical protein